MRQSFMNLLIKLKSDSHTVTMANFFFLNKHDLLKVKLTRLSCHPTCSLLIVFLYLITIIFAQPICIIYKPSGSIQIMEVVSL